MINRFINFLLIVVCIPLLSSCAEALTVLTLSTPIAQWIKYNSDVKDNTSYISMSDYTLWATYNKDFSTQLNLSNISNLNFATNLQDTSANNTKCPKVSLVINMTSTFYMNFSEPLSPKKINISILNKTQPISNYIPIIIYPKGELGFYSLENAMNYQWCQGVSRFDSKFIKNDIHDNKILYAVNLSILSDNKLCEKSFGNQCLIMHYKYDVDVIDNETNIVFFRKRLEYVENTSYVLGGVAYNPRNYYASLIVYKNREVIEREVFTDELYNALTSANALQNSTTH